MDHTARYAIITPYFREERSLLERCIDSVRAQTVPADHFLVADGFPQAWIDETGVRHFKLDRNHGDFGNTPRGVGALIAVGEEYDGIGLLDADNWLDPDHIAACLAAARACPEPCDYVIAQRTFRRPDDTIMPVGEEPEHVDTNCFFFLRGSFSAIPYWTTMPKHFSVLCDRYFYEMLRRQPFTTARVSRPTVHYRCLWVGIYRSLGETPPPDAKGLDLSRLKRWMLSLSRREVEIASRLAGVPLSISLAPIGRNAECPCGSGKRLDHCHGAPADGETDLLGPVS
jgi:glycosyltransferase involved in cell wall biosynthesis